ncbi:mechanosensitive ion channel [Candidatus Bathyarchaeota archaeon]|nr:mechanosensitive ion channel [Candidatus Bathyarchaeota archaeon]
MNSFTNAAQIFEIINNLRPEMIKFIQSIIALIIIFSLYKIISNQIDRFGLRIELDYHSLNSIRLILRVISIMITGSILFTIFELPTDLFIGGSALIGAVVGFGSSQTINNIAAGFYVLISRPFKVKDYVKIGDVEGQVEEVSINYTKLYTPSFNLILIPNTQVMNNRILNCTHEDFIKYTFTVQIPQSELNNSEIISECISPAIDEYMNKHKDMQIRRPEYFFEQNSPSFRNFKIRIFIPKGEAKSLYTLQPELYILIINYWDKAKIERAQRKK